VPVPHCTSQIPHELTREMKPGLRGDRPAANRLSNGLAGECRFHFEQIMAYVKATLHNEDTKTYKLSHDPRLVAPSVVINTVT